MFKDFFNNNHKTMLDKLIDCQLMTISKYSYENNMELGMKYERALGEIENLKHKKQTPGGVKHDLEYLTTNELIELKCGKYEFHMDYKKSGTPKFKDIPYRKSKGDSGSEIVETLPDYLLVYQKFDIKKKSPALFGLMSKDRLKSILADGRVKKTAADTYIKISRGDFDCGLIIRAKIPKMKDGYEDKINEIEARHETEKQAEIIKCLNDYKTDDFINLQQELLRA